MTRTVILACEASLGHHLVTNCAESGGTPWNRVRASTPFDLWERNEPDFRGTRSERLVRPSSNLRPADYWPARPTQLYSASLHPGPLPSQQNLDRASTDLWEMFRLRFRIDLELIQPRPCLNSKEKTRWA